MTRSVSPGCVVVYPNREKAASKSTKAIIVLLLLASVVLMLIVSIGGWSKLEGLQVIDLLWCVVYLILAYYVGARWSRGGLTLSAALGILLLITAVIAGTGLAGTSWSDRNTFGFAAPQTIFGGRGLGPDVLELFTVLLAPVQILLIVAAVYGFSQAWNVETEAPIEEARRRGYRVPPSTGAPPPKPAAA